MTRIVIFGPRDLHPPLAEIDAAVTSSPFAGSITEVVCGMQRGVDLAGKAWADERGIPVKPFPADWDAHCRAAGPIRNIAMANYCDAGIHISDGRQTRGSQNMLGQMKRRGKPVYVHEVRR